MPTRRDFAQNEPNFKAKFLSKNFRAQKLLARLGEKPAGQGVDLKSKFNFKEAICAVFSIKLNFSTRELKFSRFLDFLWTPGLESFPKNPFVVQT